MKFEFDSKFKIKNSILAALLLIFAFFILNLLPREAHAAAPWFSPNWAYRKRITLQQSKVVGTQVNFPVLVSLTDSNLASNARADGRDILFTSADGKTKLAHELEQFHASASGAGSGAGQVEAWVKIPSLDANVNTDIYMYYGNSSAAVQQATTTVWNENYVGVWHLKENPAGTAPQMMDSTGPKNNGTSNGAQVVGDQQPGKIDGSLNFDGSNDYVDVTDSNSLDLTNNFTISLWVNPASTQNQYADMLGKHVDAASGGYVIEQNSTNNNQYYVSWGDGSTFYCNAGTDTTTLTANQWQLFTITKSGTALTHYVNAAQTKTCTGASATINANTLNLALGRSQYTASNRVFSGKLDEVRVMATSTSANWITTEYNNQSATSTFFTLGSQETAPTSVGIRLRGR